MSSAIQISEFNMEICRELISNALLGLAIIQDKKLVFANRGLADVIGINLEDMLTLSSDDFMSMIYPADRNRILGTLIDGISSDKLPLRQEFRIVRKNGDIAWTDARANFIEFNGKRALQVAFMDITSRKNAEIEANKIKAEYGEILGSISDGFLAFDDDLLITYFNEAAESILGRAAPDVLGQNILDAFPEFRGSIFEDTFNCAVKEKRHISFETYFGKKPYENWYGVRVYPRNNGISVLFQEITDRKVVEETLRLSEEQYRLLFETMVQGVVYQDADGKIISANPVAERILGLSSDQMNGRTSIDPEWKAIHEDGSDFPGETHPSMIALVTGKVIENVVMGVFNPEGMEYRWININAIPQFLPGEAKPYRIYTTFEDITERKKVEDQLITSSQRFFTILSNLYASILLISDKGKVEFANQAFCDFFYLKAPPEELIGLSSQEMIEKIKNAYLYPEEEVTRIMDTVKQGEPVRGQEVAMQDGRTCLRDFCPISIAGKSYGRLWHHLDITEHKRTEENTRALCHELEMHQIELEMQNEELQRAQAELSASEEKYRDLYEFATIGYLTLEASGKVLEANLAAAAILGTERAYLISYQFQAYLTEGSLIKFKGFCRRVMDSDIKQNAELQLRGAGSDGRASAWVLVEGRAIEDGTNHGFRMAVIDITERKQVEEALRKSEQKFRSIVESSEAGIILIDDDGNIAEWNASQEYITGLKREDVLGRPAWDIKFQLIPQEQKTQEAYDKLKSFLLRLTDKGRVALKGWLSEQEIKSIDGKRKTIHEVIFPIKTEKGYNIGIIAHDTTEQMETEKSLKIKDKAVESALNAMSLASPSGDIFYANESWLKMMRYEREEIAGRSLLDFLQDPKDADEIEKQISATGRWEGELVARKKDGSTMDVHLSASTVKDKSDRSICIISSFIDISESKKIHRELMESENKLKAIFELLPIGIYVVDKDGRVVKANQSFMDFMGLSLEKLNQKKHWERRYFSADGAVLPRPKDTKDSSYKIYPAGKAMNEEKPSMHLEIGMEKENGEVVWASVRSVPTSISNWAALVAIMDITGQRKMEESLRIKDAAIEDSTTATAIADLKGNLTYANKAALDLWGYKKEEALGKPARLFWEKPEKFDPVMDALFKAGNWSGDLVGKKKDGSAFDVQLSANIVKNAAGKPLCLIGSSLDITNRKKMERELKEREERFRKIFELTPIGIQLFDADGFLVSANQVSQKIMGTIDTARHKRYNLFRDVLADVESQHKLMSGQIVNEGSWIKGKSGKAAKIDRDMPQDRKGQIYIENTITSLGVEGGEPEGYLRIQQDLTEHKLADEAMISENERLQVIYDIWKTRVKTSDMRMND